VKNVRVIWLEDEQCILFNSGDERISSIAPRFVGRITEDLQSGLTRAAAYDRHGIEDPKSRSRLDALFDHVAGGDTSPRTCGSDDKRDDERLARLLLSPTANCNLRCTYCYASAGDSGATMMTEAIALAAVDFFVDHAMPGPLTFIYGGQGEPMLNEAVVRASVTHAKTRAAEAERTAFFRLTTNGVYGEATARWIAEAFDYVNVSVDGPKAVHDAQRPRAGGQGSYEAAVATMRILHETGALGGINAVITPESAPLMPEIVRHVAELGLIDTVGFTAMGDCGRCEVSGQAALREAPFIGGLREAMAEAERLGVEVSSTNAQATYFTDHYCGGCGLNMCVSWDGYVSTCPEGLDPKDPAARELLIGEYRGEAGFTVDWDVVRKLRGRTYESMGSCTSCSYRTNCAGGCLIRAARETGTVYNKEQQRCGIVQTVLGETFRDMAYRAAVGPAAAIPSGLPKPVIRRIPAGDPPRAGGHGRLRVLA